MAKKISDKTIANLKAISPSTLVSHGVLKTADDFNEKTQRGYCCPFCGSGEHTNGTGGGSMDSENRFYCFVCRNDAVGGHKLSTIDLFARARGLEGESFNQICRKMAAEFGEPIDDEDFKISRRYTQRMKNLKIDEPPKKEEPSIDPDELALIQSDILNTSDDELEVFVKRMCGGMWRGFDFEFLRAHGIKFVYRWWLPSQRLNRPKYMPPATKRILIPSGSDFYVARLVGFSDYLDEKAKADIEQKYPKMNAGSPRLFLSRRNVLDVDEPIFCVEGALDALSIEYSGYPAVALNAGGNGDLLVDELKKRLAEKKKLPTVIIMMDSDEHGRNKFAPPLYNALIDIGCVCCVRFLFDEVTKKDFNDLLVEEGKDSLRGILQNIVEDSLSELDATAQVLAEKEEEPTVEDVADDNEVNLIDELFQGDSSDADFADRLNLFCGANVRWLKDDRAWLIYERNEVGGGMWQNSGEQNSCLLPYARALTNTMLEHAQNKEEYELAAKFKSTRKIFSSITALKGIKNILITSEDLNQHSELLNVRNGVIDLTTGKLLQASPQLLLTQQAAAVFNPKCDDKTFANFFKSVLPDEQTRAVILRFLGYTLTADVSAEKYLLIYGKGGNGKGALLLTLRTLLKDFAVELPVDTVLESRSKLTDANGRATTELSPLAMRRLGIIDELPRNARMDVAKVNRITGGDYIPMRLLHREYKDVKPSHKIIMTGNYRPKIDDPRDAALLRRLLVVNFTQDFTENPDETLKARLVTESALAGALNLIVPAAVEFYKHGLLAPSTAMKYAREDFLGENDFVGEYLSEFYKFDEHLSTKRKDLLVHMRANCAECGRYRDSDLVAMLSKVDGVTCAKDNRGTQFFKGIGLAPPQKDEQAQNQNGYDTGFVSSGNYRYHSADDFTPPPDMQ